MLDMVDEPVLWVFRKPTFLAFEVGVHVGKEADSAPKVSDGGGHSAHRVVVELVVVVVVLVVEDVVVEVVEEDAVVLNELFTLRSPGNETIVDK